MRLVWKALGCLNIATTHLLTERTTPLAPGEVGVLEELKDWDWAAVKAAAEDGVHGR